MVIWKVPVYVPSVGRYLPAYLGREDLLTSLPAFRPPQCARSPTYLPTYLDIFGPCLSSVLSFSFQWIFYGISNTLIPISREARHISHHVFQCLLLVPPGPPPTLPSTNPHLFHGWTPTADSCTPQKFIPLPKSCMIMRDQACRLRMPALPALTTPVANPLNPQTTTEGGERTKEKKKGLSVHTTDKTLPSQARRRRRWSLRLISPRQPRQSGPRLEQAPFTA